MQQNDKDSETIKYKYALVNQGVSSWVAYVHVSLVL